MAADEKPHDLPLATTYIVCGVVIEKDGKYLLVQEKWEKVYGQWNLPGGRVDQGESLEQAAVREAKEECGFDVKLEGELILLHLAVDRPVCHVYKATIIGGELNFPKDELLDAKWFTYEEIVAMKDKLRNVDYTIGAVESARRQA
jgi:8-oxo-dGTP diphosphatase